MDEEYIIEIKIKKKPSKENKSLDLSSFVKYLPGIMETFNKTKKETEE